MVILGIAPSLLGKVDRRCRGGYLNNNNNKNNNNNRVRPFSAEQQIIYDISFSSVLEAAEDCYRHKKTAHSYVKFRWREADLVELWESIRHGCYVPSTSVCFLVDVPVLREVFAASFIDRVVHHWIGMRIEPILEHWFYTQGNVSKNCRKGEGVTAAVRLLRENIDDACIRWDNDAWFCKMDLKGFFMSIDKSLLYEMLHDFIHERYYGDDIDTLCYLLSVTIFHNPENDCSLRSQWARWADLPKDKSLFHSPWNKGMAIGNLPSQLLANLVMSAFDYWIMHVKGIEYYVRFVDDFVFITHTKQETLDIIPEIKDYISEQLLLNVHPKKTYIQHISKGVKFVGAVLKPNRTYISNRTVGHFYDCVRKYNRYAEEGRQAEFLEKFVQSVNSYLGFMVRYSSYNIRRRVCNNMILPYWKGYLYFSNGFKSAKMYKKWKIRDQIKDDVRKGNLSKWLGDEI